MLSSLLVLQRAAASAASPGKAVAVKPQICFWQIWLEAGSGAFVRFTEPADTLVHMFCRFYHNREDFDPDKFENKAALGLLQRFVSNGRESDGSPTRDRLKLIVRWVKPALYPIYPSRWIHLLHECGAPFHMLHECGAPRVWGGVGGLAGSDCMSCPCARRVIEACTLATTSRLHQLTAHLPALLLLQCCQS